MGTLLLFAVSGARAQAPASAPATRGADVEEDYAAILLDGKKVGYARHTRAVEDGRVTTAQTMKLTLARDRVSLRVTAVEKSVETADGKPLSFQVVQDMGFLATTIEGTVGQDGNVRVKTSSGGSAKEQEITWPPGALLSEGLRLLSLRMGLKEGTTYSARLFETSSLRAMDANITVGPKVSTDLFGRVVKLTQVISVLYGPMGRLTMTSYVDDKLDAQRTLTSLMGMSLDLISCSKEFALSPNDTLDFFDKVLIAAPTPLKDPKAAKAVRYRLQPLGREKLQFVSTDEQTVKAGQGNEVELTVRPLGLASGVKFPYAGSDANLLAALKPTQFLQCDDPRVIALAKEAVAGAKDSAQAVQAIEEFVRRYITKKDLSVGYASAAEVAESRQGDCTEHAVLAAAMCRAAGIPAQVVVGVAYVPAFGEHKDIFGPHAWARAFVGGRWVSLDAALNGFDAGHITMGYGDGDPMDFFGIVNLLGNVKIVEMSEGR
jgi:hypothetical protein